MQDRTLRDPPLAVVTAVSSRVAFELARQCAGNGFDLFVAAEDATVQDLGARLRIHGTAVQTAQADPAEPGGVQGLLQLLGCRAAGRCMCWWHMPAMAWTRCWQGPARPVARPAPTHS